MDEEKYAKEIVGELQARGISPQEWEKYRKGLENELKERIPQLDVSKIIEDADTLRVRNEIKQSLDRVEEQIIGTSTEREKILKKLREENTEKFRGVKKERIPTYLLGPVRKNKRCIEAPLKNGPKWTVRVQWETVSLATHRMLELDEYITPYRLRKETRVGRGEARAIIRYLWKEGCLEPKDWTRAGNYISVGFRPTESLSEAKFPSKGAEDN